MQVTVPWQEFKRSHLNRNVDRCCNLATSRGDCGVAVVGDSAYIVGGFNDGNWCAPTTSVEKIDLTTMSLTSTGLDLSIGRGDKAVVALNDRIHVMGGETKDSSCSTTPLRDVEIYESEISMWKYAGEIPYGLTRFRLASAATSRASFCSVVRKALWVRTVQTQVTIPLLAPCWNISRTCTRKRTTIMMNSHSLRLLWPSESSLWWLD